MPAPKILLGATAAILLGSAALAWRAPVADAPARLAAAITVTQLHLTATQTPEGPVRLTWRWEGETPPGEVRLVRAVHPDGLVTSGEDLHPAARWTLPGGRAGTFTDPAPADGTTYLYQARAGTATSAVAEVATAPRALPATLAAPTLRVDKATYVLALVDGGRVLKRYPFAMGRAPTRRKLHFDNASTPEGIYRVVGLQPRATYYKAFDIDYPNALDRVRHAVAAAGRPGFPAIGGEIQIHAGGGTQANWTFGCMALRDADIDELFAARAVRVGTEVRIWGGELAEAEVDAMATRPAAAELARWRAALAARGHATDGTWGPAFWATIGRYQRAEGLAVTCWPDAVTGRRLGLARARAVASRGDACRTDARIEGADFRTIARVKRDGDGWVLQDASWRTVGRVARDGSGWRVQDASWRTQGRLKPDGDGWLVQDASWRTTGRLRPDGGGWQVQDGSYRTIGRVTRDGTAQDASYRTIARLGEPDPVRAALLYGFFPCTWRP